MDFFENHLKINQLLITEFLKMVTNLEEDIRFYKDYPFEKSEIKVQQLEHRKKQIQHIIGVYNTTGKLHG